MTTAAATMPFNSKPEKVLNSKLLFSCTAKDVHNEMQFISSFIADSAVI